MAAVHRTHAPVRIVRNPRICGGEPTIEGTRVPVRSVVITYQFYQDLERVQIAYPALDRQAIEMTLDHYATHREEFDRLIDENERAIESAD